MLKTQTYFDHIYATANDPWGYEQHWYEARKRQICLSVLLQPQYQNALEVGCSNGVFSEALGQRCSQLLCLDGHPKAVNLAQNRLKNYPHIQVRQAWVPAELPQQQFDLIVIGEILYYLDLEQIQTFIAWLNTHLSATGTLLCCHWRHPIEGFTLDGNQVHQLLAPLALQHYLSLQDPDFLVDVWTKSSLSLAAQEGIL